MTSAKITRAIVESVFESLSRANFDPSRTVPGRVNPGFMANREDIRDAESMPSFILRLLKSRHPNSPQSSKQDIKHFVEKTVWDRSFHVAYGVIAIDLAVGRKPTRHIQEVREAIQVLRAIGEKPIADMYEGFLKKSIGEE